jgi:FtsZ-binding cell division protein ZapB
MAIYQVNFTVRGKDIKRVTEGMHTVLQGAEEFGVGLLSNPRVEKQERNPSRAVRLSEAYSKIEDAKSEIEALKEEMTGWRDNLPEGLQDSDRGSALQEAADNLEEAHDSLEEVTGTLGNVEFPGMFG